MVTKFKNRIFYRLFFPYEIIPELKDVNLSPLATGVFYFLLKKENHWFFNLQDIQDGIKIDMISIRQALKELEENKLFLKVKLLDCEKFFIGWEYVFIPGGFDFYRNTRNNKIQRLDKEKKNE